jgi:hypothetical protein
MAIFRKYNQIQTLIDLERRKFGLGAVHTPHAIHHRMAAPAESKRRVVAPEGFSYAMQLRLSPRRLRLLCRSMYIVASLET